MRNIQKCMLFCLLTIFLVSCTKFEANAQNKEFLNAKDIQFTLIGKSEKNNRFRTDFQQRGPGIIQIEDHIWNEYLSKALTHDKKTKINEATPSSYDMVIQTKEKSSKVKIWFVDNHVYFSDFPQKDLYQLSQADGEYFKMVMRSIEKKMPK